MVRLSHIWLTVILAAGLLLASCTPPTTQVNFETAVVQTIEASYPTLTAQVAPNATPAFPSSPTLPPATPTPTMPAQSAGGEPARIEFPAGGTSAILTGSLQPNGAISYVFAAIQNQFTVLKLNASSPEVRMTFSGQGAEPAAVASTELEKRYEVILWATQDYTIQLKAGSSAVSYTLELIIVSKLTIQGRVADSLGQPIAGIGIAMVQPQGNLRIDAKSGADGGFAVEVPMLPNAPPWQVSVVSFECTSRVVDANCDLAGFTYPQHVELVQPPQSGELVFVFQVLGYEGAVCPLPGASQGAYENEYYCFIYPAASGYALTETGAGAVRVQDPPQGGNVEPVVPYLEIQVLDEPAGNRTIKQIVDQWVIDNGLSGLSLTFDDRQVGGEPAIGIRGEPGIAGSYRLFVAHDNLIFTFFLFPTDISLVSGSINLIWKTVVDDFAFK
ncbi:MAG: carboxypeptidase regulatory-like domain-containing protein [Anaerolineales bacterium]|nr:carboxypeptidase regulatory-like domain-containing protein [Anaerolineales bacterium]